MRGLREERAKASVMKRHSHRDRALLAVASRHNLRSHLFSASTSVGLNVAACTGCAKRWKESATPTARWTACRGWAGLDDWMAAVAAMAWVALKR